MHLLICICPPNGLRICYIGLVKNQKLPANIITPTTKAVDHDVPIAPEEVCFLFDFFCISHGLILV